MMEIDPSEKPMPCSFLHATESDSSSAGIEVLPEMQLVEDPEEPVLENMFHTP